MKKKLLKALRRIHQQIRYERYLSYFTHKKFENIKVLFPFCRSLSFKSLKLHVFPAMSFSVPTSFSFKKFINTKIFFSKIKDAEPCGGLFANR